MVVPANAAPIFDGAVVSDGGRIVGVGRATEINRGLPPHEEFDLGQAVLLPGLINAHCHLELSDMHRAPRPPGDFVDWLTGVRSHVRQPTADGSDPIEAAVAAGIRQCVRFGVTAVGDISQNVHITRRFLSHGKVRVVSYGEAIGLARRRARFDQLLTRAVDLHDETATVRVGVSPHAPYTVDLPGYVQAIDIARRLKLPICTHLAEHPEESDFLKHHSGMFRRMWDDAGWWEDPVQTFDGSPIAMARAVGLLAEPMAALAHVNYVDDDEMSLLAAGRASVVYCPRTHDYFGHPQHRWREMVSRGINLAIGTDSCASSPDLNPVDDLRHLWRTRPERDPQRLWRLITVNAARAIGQEHELGTLSVGKQADMTAFAFSSNDPLAEILEDPSRLPLATWVAGQRLT
jgi:cytosine/adenosine deaminase-related metal-dependent hydrolase